MFADRLEIDFAPPEIRPRGRSQAGRSLYWRCRESYRFLEETISAYSELEDPDPPHITLALGEFDDPRGELLQALGDIFARWDPFAFDLALVSEMAGVRAEVRNGGNEMYMLRDDVLDGLEEDELDLRRTTASGGGWRPHVTLYRRTSGVRSSLRVRQEIARDWNRRFDRPLVGYATGASLWLGDELIESFPFLGETDSE